MPRLSPGVHLLWPTVHATVFDAERPGPTALIQAGIHGDEIAGVHALQELLEQGLRPAAGRLIVIPVMNPPAYRLRKRFVPDGHDLNRVFPGDPTADRYEPRLAATFMQLCRDERPALVATLHESAKRYDPARVPSFGQTLVYGVEPVPPLVSAVVDRMNRSASAEERWAPLYYPVATSSTEVIVDALGPQNTVGVCVETWSGFDEARRVAMHKEIVLHLLVGIGVLAPAGRDTDPPEASR